MTSIASPAFEFLTSSDDYIIISSADRRIIFANKAYCTLLGMPEAQLIGIDFTSFFPLKNWQTMKCWFKR